MYNLQVGKRCFFSCAGMTIQVESDLPFEKNTFHARFEEFRVKEPGGDLILIQHHFYLPEMDVGELGEPVHRNPPYAIYKQGSNWVYLGSTEGRTEGDPFLVAFFNHDHSRARIHHRDEAAFRQGGSHSLLIFTTDQVFLARVLASRNGCLLHSAAAILDGQGLLFLGHSGVGKSTLLKALMEHAETLSDDRNVVRYMPDGVRLFGTWSYGDVPDVSSRSAPLRAIFLLERESENRLVPIDDSRAIVRRLLKALVRPLQTADWWERTLVLTERVARQVPGYVLQFDDCRHVFDMLKQL